jgi:DNA-binding MarR family transcriptional regulator
MKPNSTFLCVELNKLVDLMRIKAEIILKRDFEIDYSQFLILHTINRLDKSNQQVISECIGFTGAGVSKQIDKLEALGLVSKIMDKTNRRSNLITLTEQGKKIVSTALPILEDELDKYINPEDKQIMSKITNQVIINIL